MSLFPPYQTFTTPASQAKPPGLQVTLDTHLTVSSACRPKGGDCRVSRWSLLGHSPRAVRVMVSPSILFCLCRPYEDVLVARTYTRALSRALTHAYTRTYICTFTCTRIHSWTRLHIQPILILDREFICKCSFCHLRCMCDVHKRVVGGQFEYFRNN